MGRLRGFGEGEGKWRDLGRGFSEGWGANWERNWGELGRGKGKRQKIRECQGDSRGAECANWEEAGSELV